MDGSSETTASTPEKIGELDVYENGEYWIETKIRVGENSFDAFDIVQVDSVPPGKTKPIELFGLPEKQIGIIAVIVIAIGLIGLKISRKPKAIEI